MTDEQKREWRTHTEEVKGYDSWQSGFTYIYYPEMMQHFMGKCAKQGGQEEQPEDNCGWTEKSSLKFENNTLTMTIGRELAYDGEPMEVGKTYSLIASYMLFPTESGDFIPGEEVVDITLQEDGTVAVYQLLQG